MTPVRLVIAFVVLANAGLLAQVRLKPDTTYAVPDLEGVWENNSATPLERFRRLGPDALEYTFTVDDPGVWTRPWTAVITWKRASGDVLEYACHEGNYSLRGMLSALRAEEAKN